MTRIMRRWRMVSDSSSSISTAGAVTGVLVIAVTPAEETATTSKAGGG